MTTTNKIAEEYQKCKDNPYYFAITYYKVIDNDFNEIPFSTILTEKEFNNYVWNYFGNIKTN